jgi:hypothetical protein
MTKWAAASTYSGQPIRSRLRSKVQPHTARLQGRPRRVVRENAMSRTFLVIVNAGSEWQARAQGERSAELTLNQNGDAITGTLAFTHPQGGRVQKILRVANDAICSGVTNSHEDETIRSRPAISDIAGCGGHVRCLGSRAPLFRTRRLLRGFGPGGRDRWRSS